LRAKGSESRTRAFGSNAFSLLQVTQKCDTIKFVRFAMPNGTTFGKTARHSGAG
jgi:hypothetical protein